MINAQPSKTFRGTVDEVFSHRNEIPHGALLELNVFERLPEEIPEDDGLDGKSVFEAFEKVIGTVSFQPTDLGRRAEEYLDGFGGSGGRRKDSD